MEDAYLSKADLRDANLHIVRVNGKSLMWDCLVSRETNCEGLALGSAQIDPATKQLLEYNVRRTNWERWYKDHNFLRWPAGLFWLASDYGRSTGRVVSMFFSLALAFAALY